MGPSYSPITESKQPCSCRKLILNYSYFLIFRKLYAPSYNPITDQEEGSDITFSDFIQLVVEGPIELSKFWEENQVQLGSEYLG